MRYLQKRKNPVPIYTLGDLTNETKIIQLAHDLCEKYSKIRSDGRLILKGLSLQEKRIYASYQTKDVWDDIKIHHSDTYKRDNKIVKKLLAKNIINSNTEIGETLKKKCLELINN